NCFGTGEWTRRTQLGCYAHRGRIRSPRFSSLITERSLMQDSVSFSADDLITPASLIRQRRQALNLTQLGLAQRISHMVDKVDSVSQALVSQWERGAARPTNKAVVAALVDTLGLSPGEAALLYRLPSTDNQRGELSAEVKSRL